MAIIQGDNWLDENFSRWESVWELSVREFSWVGVFRLRVFLGGSCPGGNFPGGSFPGWELSRWEFSWVGVVQVGIFWVGVFLGGNCPGETYPGWEFSLVEVFRVGIVWWETFGWQFFGWEFSCYPSYHVGNSMCSSYNPNSRRCYLCLHEKLEMEYSQK